MAKQQPPGQNDPQYQQYLEWQRQQAQQQGQQPPPGYAYPPPPAQVIIVKQQRSRGCMWLVIAIVVIGIIGAVGYNQAKQSGQLAFTVTYKVSGTATDNAITYENSTGSTAQQSNAPLPWQQSYNFTDGSFFGTLTATVGANGGSLTCQILVNNKVVKQASSSGTFASASCSGSFSASDGK